MHRQQPNYDYSICEVYIYICIIKITKKNNLIFHIDLWYLDKSRFWKANYMHYKHIYNIIYIYKLKPFVRCTWVYSVPSVISHIICKICPELMLLSSSNFGSIINIKSHEFISTLDMSNAEF